MGNDRFENICGVGSYDYGYDYAPQKKIKRCVTDLKNGYLNYRYISKMFRVRFLREKDIIDKINNTSNEYKYYKGPSKGFNIKLITHKEGEATFYFTYYTSGSVIKIILIKSDTKGDKEILNTEVNDYQSLCDEIINLKFKRYRGIYKKNSRNSVEKW